MLILIQFVKMIHYFFERSVNIIWTNEVMRNTIYSNFFNTVIIIILILVWFEKMIDSFFTRLVRNMFIDQLKWTIIL